MSSQPTILFDGVCNLCNASVRLILKHERDLQFRFAALQSEAAQAMLLNFKGSKIYDSVLLIENGRLYQQSDAAFRIARRLNYFRHLYFLIYLPRWVRNPMYYMVSKYRYKLFGKQTHCMAPTEKVKERFL
jgi:predicted DCC family thiol-disulfide oxidoreductase YuxK